MPENQLTPVQKFDKLCKCASTLGISSRVVSDRLGVSVMTLSRWRKGSHQPREDKGLERAIADLKTMINAHIDSACEKVEDC